MASKGAKARAEARKQKDKWKAKRWYNIRAPRQPWHFKLIGETLGEDDHLLIGRIYETTQQEVDGDFSKMNVKLKFRVTEVVGQDAITEFAGHEVLKDHVRRQVRRNRGKVDDVVDAITADGYYIRVKPMIVTSRRVKTSQKQGLRNLTRDIILQSAAKNTWIKLQQSMLNGELENEITEAARKVAAVRTVMLRKSQLVQSGVVTEDGPTLDEVHAEEARAAAAKKAALEAAMAEEAEEAEEEDATPDVLAAAESHVEAEAPSEEAAEAEEAEEAPEEVAEAAADEDLTSVTVAELKERLKAAGKKVSGTKAELIARLNE